MVLSSVAESESAHAEIRSAGSAKAGLDAYAQGLAESLGGTQGFQGPVWRRAQVPS